MFIIKNQEREYRYDINWLYFNRFWWRRYKSWKNGIISENEQDLFDNESEASYAQMWDAEVFTKSILHKELDDATYSEVYSAFKAVARHIEIENVSLESLYNTNYEQSTEDDFD